LTLRGGNNGFEVRNATVEKYLRVIASRDRGNEGAGSGGEYEDVVVVLGAIGESEALEGRINLDNLRSYEEGDSLLLIPSNILKYQLVAVPVFDKRGKIDAVIGR